MALRLRTPTNLLRQLGPALLARSSSATALYHARGFHTSLDARQPGLPPRGSGGHGQPLGNIFGQQQKKPGETLAESGVDLTKLAAEGTGR